jgi:hypothetical protein
VTARRRARRWWGAAAVGGALLAAGSCSDAAAARERTADAPWAAPGRRLDRAAGAFGWPDTAGGTRYQLWVDARGRVRESHDYVLPAFTWLERHGARDADRAAPVVYAMVSVDPVVVVLAPDSGRDAAPAPTTRPPVPSVSWAGHRVALATTIPVRGPLRWFSPELGRLPAPVPMRDSDEGEIALPDGRLVLTRAGESWRAVRR